MAVAAMLAACGPTPEQEQQLAELPIVTSERDRLQGEVDRLNAEIQQVQTELSNAVMIPAATTESGQQASAPARVTQLVAHVTEMEEQLTAAEQRLRSVNATSATQQQQISQLETAIAEERVAMQGQRQRISQLEMSIANLEAETIRQGEVNIQLTQTVNELTDESNKVWYVVGTKEELLERGLITEEGGSRVLFIFGKRGKTIVPARTLDPSMFTAADKRTLSDIQLSFATMEEDGDDSDEEQARWMVVTPQNLSAVASPLDDRGRVLGDALSITNPEQFWANSRYLIVVRS
jgi:hypothetical protein